MYIQEGTNIIIFIDANLKKRQGGYVMVGIFLEHYGI
jgi:hypothetical protein